MQMIKKGERASVSGVIISSEDYYLLQDLKKTIEAEAELKAKLNAGEDV